MSPTGTDPATVEQPCTETVRPQTDVSTQFSSEREVQGQEIFVKDIRKVKFGEPSEDAEDSDVSGDDEDGGGGDVPQVQTPGVVDQDQCEGAPRDPTNDADAQDAEREYLQARPPVTAPTPHTPTQASIDSHNAMGHAVYRCWCEACVTGQGREDRHLKGHGHDGDVPVVAYDYAFFSGKDEEEANKCVEITKIVAGKYSKSATTFAHVTPGKGLKHGNYNVECVTSDLKRLGYKRVILKSDKEPAIVKQVMQIAKIAGIEVLAEFAHTGDPQSNGMAERTVGQVKGEVTQHHCWTGVAPQEEYSPRSTPLWGGQSSTPQTA